jgi:hypothetical protein
VSSSSGSESANIFCFILFRIKRLQETTRDFKKNKRLGRLAGSPQYEHFLPQLACFGFRVSKNAAISLSAEAHWRSSVGFKKKALIFFFILSSKARYAAPLRSSLH